jgi:hypothetical protein
MIRYTLACDEGHEFESWFPGSAAFDEQARRGLVECPTCRSTHVRKSIMAPALTRGGGEREAAAAESPVVAEPSSPAVDEGPAALREMVRALRAAVVAHTTDVGAAFPEEARKMHFGEAEHRPIRGEATPDEARELIEDGVAIMPVPVLPEERN